MKAPWSHRGAAKAAAISESWRWLSCSSLITRVLALAIIAAVAVLMLGGALALFARKPPGNDVVAIRDFRPVWNELKWSFPVDQWGVGKAFTCQAAKWGSEVNLYVRAKIGCCNCSTDVADDDELDRVADVDLIGSGHAPLASGRAIAVAWMKGRSRPYTIASVISYVKKTRHSIERSSALVASLHDPFSAASITNIAEFDLRHTG